jgi:ParB-like chromosome segregation protein Spo0J
MMATHEPGEDEVPFPEDAALFPLRDEEALEALAQDIRAHGQRRPISRRQGAIIDGRNRYLACRRAGVEPVFAEWDGPGDVLDFIVSENLHRRHLTTAQKAAIAADLKEKLAERARARMAEGGARPRPGARLRKVAQVCATFLVLS